MDGFIVLTRLDTGSAIFVRVDDISTISTDTYYIDNGGEIILTNGHVIHVTESRKEIWQFMKDSVDKTD